MKTLAIDTATKTQVLALTDGADVVARRLAVVPANHSESLLANIDDMLRQAQWDRSALDLVACGLGPGTFTGLRVGLATAKAIARSAGAALVGVSSCEAIARPLAPLFDGVAVTVIDARRGEVYFAAYETRGGMVVQELVAPTTKTPEQVRAFVDAQPGAVILSGNGVIAFDELQQWEREDVRVMAQPWHTPSSVSIALLAQRTLRERGGDDIATLEPNYVRPSDAERGRA